MDIDMELEIHTDPYDVTSNEPRPDSVVYTEIFRDLQYHSKRAVALLRDPLASSKFHNVVTKGLANEIARRTRHENADQVKFAVAGDMKAGKSSVINSILSIGTIARKGDGGDSCTWVVQRYMKMFRGQTSPFTARVQFFNQKEVRSIISGLLAKFYRAANNDQKEDDDEEDIDQQVSSVESFGEMRDTITAFTALFCDKDESGSEVDARKFLKQAKSDNDEIVLDILVEWAGDLVQTHLDGKEFVTVEGSTTEDLLWALQPYTCQIGGIDGDGVVSPWPLVSVIDFGLDHPLLNEGIVFVDSPGLSDANAARSHNAIKHHRKCTHNIAVAEIGRAEADAALRTNLERGFRTRGSANTILVLTHGDSIDPETEVTGTPMEKKCVAKLDKEIKDLKAQKNKKLQEHQKARPDDRDDIYEKIKSIGSELRQKLTERDGYRLEMRNRKVTTKMQDLYKSLTQDPKPLSAFAVGNKVYTQYQAGFTADEKPHLSVKQTGIPALRHRLYTMPIEGRLNETLHFAEVQLPSLMNSIELYCSQMHMARKGEIEAIVLEPKKNVRDLVRPVLDELREQAAEEILQKMKGYESDWIKIARKVCSRWTAEYNGKLGILKKEGFEKGKKGNPDVNWNAELARIGVEEMDIYFQAMQSSRTSWKASLADAVKKLCDSTRDIIKRDRHFCTMALEPFLRNFSFRNRDFAKQLDGVARKLNREASALHERSVMHHDDAFITIAMRPIYEEARGIKGRGAPKRRAEFIERKVTKRDGTWMKVHDHIDTAFNELLNKYEDFLAKLLEELFDSLHRDFLLLCADTETKDEKEKVQEEILRSRLKENLVEVKAMVGVGGVIPDLVEKCNKYGRQANSSQLFVQ